MKRKRGRVRGVVDSSSLMVVVVDRSGFEDSPTVACPGRSRLFFAGKNGGSAGAAKPKAVEERCGDLRTKRANTILHTQYGWL